MAGKLLWHTTMSLDGFIARPDDAVGWVFRHFTSSEAVDEVIATTGAVLAGRRWYDRDTAVQKPDGWQEIYGGAWSGPVFVLTHRPFVSDNPMIKVVSEGIEHAVASALDAAGGKNVVVFGSSLNQQCIEAGLLDEILIHLVPVLLGDGVRFFGRPGADELDLETVSVTRQGQMTDLRFRVRK
jgi:dihydrofolate reductase